MRSSSSLTHAGLVLLMGVVLGTHSPPAIAFCPDRCRGNFSNECVAVCGYERRSPEQIERDNRTEAERQQRSREVIDGFVTRRNKLHTTDPSSPQFKSVLEAYKKARRLRDGDLLGRYASETNQNMLGILLTGGSALQVLDEPYYLPMHSRQAFHAFAASQMGRVLKGADILSIFGGDGSVIVSEEDTAVGSYGRYASLADKEELDVWKSNHGIATEPFPPEPVSPQEAERRRRQTAEINAVAERVSKTNPAYNNCLADNGMRMGTRPSIAQIRAAEATCAPLKPPRR